MTILITGFGPYREPQNASGALIESMLKALPDSLAPLSEQLVFKIIHCDTSSRANEHEDLECQLRELLERHRPTICIHTGQSPAVSRITLERIGRNWFLQEPIDPQRPASYIADLPNMVQLGELLERQGIPVGYSNECGEHACNHILFSSRHFASQLGYRHAAGFVHIPLLPGQVTKAGANPPRMPLAVTRTALELIVRHVAESEPGQAG